MSKEDKKGAGGRGGRKKRATSQNNDAPEEQEQSNSRTAPQKQVKGKPKQVKSPPKQILSQNNDFEQVATPPSPKQVQAKNKDSKKMIRKPQIQQEPEKKKQAKQPQIKETPEALLEYFIKQNRPFSVNWLKDTLCLKAAQLIKNIELLVSKGELIMKEVGASKVYLVNQSLMPQVNQQEMNDLTEKMKQLETIFTDIKGQIKDQQDKIKHICRVPRLQDLVKQEEDLIEKEQRLENKKLALSSQGGRVELPIVESTEAKHGEIEGKAKKYKRIYRDAIGEILQESELTVEQFENIIGIQRDIQI